MTAATVEKTKLEALQEQEAKLAIAVDEARARLALYPEQLHEARSRAIYAKPNVRPGAELNSEISKLNAKEKKDLDGLRTLEADLSACAGVLAVEAQRVTEEATAEARKRLELLHENEKDVWIKAGGLLGELANVYSKYVAISEEEDRLADRLAAANGLDAARAVIPAPASFKDWLLLLHEAATSAEVRAEPHTEQIVDSGIYGLRDAAGNDIGGAVYDTRFVGTRTLETRRRLDERDILYHVVPDLRSIVSKLSLSGRVPKFTAE